MNWVSADISFFIHARDPDAPQQVRGREFIEDAEKLADTMIHNSRDVQRRLG